MVVPIDPMTPKRTATLTAEGRLREELLNTYEEYCHLFAEIIKHLNASPDTASYRSDSPATLHSRVEDRNTWITKIQDASRKGA